ncbi:N-acetyldiaminopimelate deacetylase [Amphibacillus marinus]|uniref:N-acetyldiaminopimelate deacetylase n=1 Tax=Amphibacillus marinus TaxID=872970 RepID=A0A1H8IAT6_9BACI|nr:N-acetyldiaminopimelate deacetylase [Amphibacillus marinus]SEN65312.1 N-acetyldiaminopimelate deacetylase [Amphibacillus marinus]
MNELTYLQQIRRDLHKIPELGFKEFKTQAYLLAAIKQFSQTNLTIETWETGILVMVKGTEPTRTVGFRADIDGLPIVEQTDLLFQSIHQGKMHACGHDFHMAIALAVLKRLSEQPAQDNVLFIFQPAEEGPGGALPLLKSGQLNKYGLAYIFALHIAPELPVGTISSRQGLLFANTSELFIDFKGRGGHAAYPHLTHDMVVAASSYVAQLQHIVSRVIDPIESAVVTVGKITGGTVQNVIAEHARLEGTIRTGNPATIAKIKHAIENFAKGFEVSHHCQINLDYGSNYYQVYNNKEYAVRFEKLVKAGPYQWHDATAAMTGEDFGYFLKDIPGFMFWLGVGSDYGLHHSKLTPNEDALLVGANIVETAIRNL